MDKPSNVGRILSLLRAIPRPKQLPTFPRGKFVLRFFVKKGSQRCCPLGLLPYTRIGVPTTLDDCGWPYRYIEPFNTFVGWWDRLTESEAKDAVDFIWPRKRSVKR